MFTNAVTNPMDQPTSTKAQPGGSLGRAEVRQLIEQVCPTKEYQDKKVMLIVPDGTRTAPIGLLFRALHDQIGQAVKAFDVLIALGTHPPMSEKAICERLEITQTERSGKFAGVNVYNHEWDNPAALQRVGVEGAGASNHFVENDAERKDVGAGVLRTAHDLFGAPISRRAEQPGVTGFTTGDAGHAKVSELHATIRGDENVGGFDVAVNDAALVRDVGCFRRVSDPSAGAREWQCALFENAIERNAVNKFHDEIRRL